MLFRSTNNAFNLLIQGYSGGTASILAMLFPILVSIPYTSSYIIDMKSGYLKYILTRTKITNYIIIRIIINGLVGGFVLFISLSIAFIMFVLLKGTNSSEIYSQTIIFKDVLNTNPYLYVLLILLNSFVCGFVFATFGLGFSTLLKNTYLTILFPFLFYILSGTLLVRFNPLFHAAVTYVLDYGGSSITTVIVYDLIMLLIGITTFVLGVSKNVEQEL